MRKMRLLAVAVVALLGLTAVAYAQSGANEYTVDGSVQANGGSKKKPKASGFKFAFTIKAPGDTIPMVVKTFNIGIEGTRVNTKVAPTCTAQAMDQNQSDSKCPKGSLIGTGTIGDAVGTSGNPFSSAVYCDLPVKIYNSGTNKAALWIKTGPPQCLAAVAQAIPATWKNSAKGSALIFTVPEGLRHQLGLDLAVTSASTSFKKITKKVKGKTVGYFESIGCKDKKRDITATFTDEAGASKTVKKTLSRC
jgi:hypothetical protein